MSRRLPDGEQHAARLAPLGAALLLTGGAMLTGLGAILALLGAALLLLSCHSRRDGLLLLGPVATSELARRSRRRWAWQWRTVYAGGAGLIVVLNLTTYAGGWDPSSVPRRQLSYANTQIAGWFITCFFGLVVVLSLQLFPAALVEDRIGKRWEILRTTDLRPREILLGKFFGRLPVVLEPLLVAAPVVAVLPLYGEVSPLMILALVLGCVGLTFSIGGIGLLYSLFAKKVSAAIGPTLLLFFVYVVLTALALFLPLRYPWPWLFDLVYVLGCGNPFVHSFYFQRGGTGFEADLLLAAWHFALFHFGLFFVFLFIAARRLPTAVPWEPMTSVTVKSFVLTRRNRQPGSKPVKQAVPRPPVTDESIVWWERYGWLQPGQMAVVNFLLSKRLWYVSAFSLIATVLALLRDLLPLKNVDAGRHSVIVVTAALLVIGSGLMLFPPLFRAARCMAKERQADTMETLLLTDLSNREMLFQKWKGVALCDLPTLYGMAALALPVALLGLIPLVGTALALLGVAAGVGLLAALGLAVGVTAKSPFRASIGAMFALYLASNIVGGFFNVTVMQARPNEAYLSAVLPPIVFVAYVEPRDTFQGHSGDLRLPATVAWCVGMCFYGALSYGCHRVAVARFGRGR